MDRTKVLMGATYESFKLHEDVTPVIKSMAGAFISEMEYIAFDRTDLTFYVWDLCDGSRLDQHLIICLYGEKTLDIIVNIAC